MTTDMKSRTCRMTAVVPFVYEGSPVRVVEIREDPAAVRRQDQRPRATAGPHTP